MHYTILTWATNPVLRAVADPVQHIDNDIKQLAEDMKLVCREHDGVGLAAPQIGLSLKMIYITHRRKGPKWLKYVGEQVMLNPEILAHAETMNSDVEWCLSLPHMTGKVKRYDWVRVQFQNTDWEVSIKNYKGFDARIIQHEIDHINGILFIDKAKDIKISK